MSLSTRHSPLVTLRSALVVALLTALALTLAYQVRAQVTIDVGGSYDAPYVARFFDGENDKTQTYRWTRDTSRIELDAQNLAAPWLLRVRMNGYRPNRPARVEVRMNGAPVDSFLAHDGWEVYEIEGNVAADVLTGNNTLVFISDTFVPQKEIAGSTDARKLGVTTDWIELTPARSNAFIGNDDVWVDFGSAPRLPPLATIARWAFACALLYVSARGIGVPPKMANLVVTISIVLTALSFAFARPLIGYYTAPFLYLAFALAGLAFLLVLLLPRLASRFSHSLDARTCTALSAIILLSIALKWGGAWYPQFRSSDLLFHAHRLEFVTQGNLFFTSELPDAARRVVPYPPALYVALSPFSIFSNNYSSLLVLFNALADALAILAIYFAARVVLRDARFATGATRYALFAAFLFAFNPVSFWIYSWGNHTNIFAQDAATIFFALLLTQALVQGERSYGTNARIVRQTAAWHDSLSLPPRGQERYGERSVRARNFLCALFFLLLASVGHLGVFLSLLAFLPLAIVVRLTSRDENARRDALALGALLLAGLVLSWALYYAAFAAALMTQTYKFLGDLGAGRAAGRGAITLARIGDVGRYTTEQLGGVLLLLGLGGILLAWKNFAARARAVWGAWLIVGVAFALVSIGATFSTRYTLWAAPALALSGALALVWMWERGRVWQIAVHALCAIAFAQTVWLWFDRVWNGYH
ncbi:MAG: hypothetical protein HY741_23585 [Chloroflexi bacterium]|nr:hypothetical protein [Chloroflexota bacterium]